MKIIDKMKLSVRWQPVENGYPPPVEDDFYGERYSESVLAGNEITGQVSIVAYMWDYKEEGWLYATMEEGTDPCDYEVQHVSHWCLWPKCDLVCLD